jgi:hypothetical protein
MKKLSYTLTLIFLAIIILPSTAQDLKFRHGMFFHHSTGGNIYGPNGSTTSVPQQAVAYNTLHNLTGTDSVYLNETWYPVSADNEWSTWHTIFLYNTPEHMCSYCTTNPIIMVKSCYPSSNMTGVGSPEDTLNPTLKSLYNYKWHWRKIIHFFSTHPEHFFVIWTNAPLVASATNASEALLSHKFSTWAKDTLANGLDATFGAFPPNVYVFDYFHKLTNASHYLDPQYAVSLYDSHPNAAATALVAPQLVNETFNHSIAYEATLAVHTISGTVSYDNSLHTPLVNVKVYLKTACCTIVDSTFTDATGHYSFEDMAAGAYNIVVSCTKPWGGVNSDDALVILKHYVGIVPLEGLRHLAANPTNTHFINSTDALMTAKRFVGLINNFPTGDWTFELTSVTFTGTADVVADIKGICYGDVNGSYLP